MGNKKSALTDPSTKAAIARAMEEFGQQMLLFRKSMKMKQYEFAEKTGLSTRSRSSISALENGNHTGLKFKKMIEICRRLGYDIKLSYVPLNENERMVSAGKNINAVKAPKIKKIEGGQMPPLNDD